MREMFCDFYLGKNRAKTVKGVKEGESSESKAYIGLRPN